ncbi:hypothetical protein [Cohnella rhizosphaerae]|uniref:Uncharacterized protein n=1 Tax=Cohnella rhizosphaerae TaxID=1457232 RepID=A0A9X4QTD6_9BACL|nr:hypothetical protein [Cohnella rhizosphaerae]MDG0810595.1 hypothetical protein [Cohnella rhizosphaerae]
MKKKYRKMMFFSILLVAIIIVTYAYLTNSSDNSALARESMSTAESAVHEVLPIGETKKQEGFSSKEELAEWSVNKQSELQLSIAKQLKLESQNVKIVLGSVSNVKDAEGYYDLTGSMVLRTELTYDETTMENLVEDIINSVTNDAKLDARISKEVIMITNANGDVLYPSK